MAHHGKWVKVPTIEAREGDSASHLFLQLDPRVVTKVDHAKGHVFLYLPVGEAGPFPLSNYSYQRWVWDDEEV